MTLQAVVGVKSCILTFLTSSTSAVTSFVATAYSAGWLGHATI
jgi:hypothetical protein